MKNYKSTINRKFNLYLIGTTTLCLVLGWFVFSCPNIFHLSWSASAYNQCNTFNYCINQCIDNSSPVSVNQVDDIYDGYFQAFSDGKVCNFGFTDLYGDASSTQLNSPIVSMALMSNNGSFYADNGTGYYLVARDGSVYAYGSAVYYGGVNNSGLNKTSLLAPGAKIVGMAVDPNGGYWIVDNQGHTYAFGGAPYLGNANGSTGIVGITTSPNGNGFLLISNSGQIYSFGDAPNFLNFTDLNNVTGITSVNNGICASAMNGSVSCDGVGWMGDLGSASPPGGIIGISSISPGADNFLSGMPGYLLLGGNGQVYTYGEGTFYRGNSSSTVPPPQASLSFSNDNPATFKDGIYTYTCEYINYATSGAKSAYLTNYGDLQQNTNGRVSVCPTETTTYTLVATNSNFVTDQVSGTITVVVTPPSSIEELDSPKVSNYIFKGGTEILYAFGCNLNMQNDGNLVDYCDGKSVWSSNTYGNPGAYLAFQVDGNVVIYSSNNTVLWDTSTQNYHGDKMQLNPQTGLFQVGILNQTNFNLLYPKIYQPSSQSTSKPSPGSVHIEALTSPFSGNNLFYGNSEVLSAFGCNLNMQNDGNLVDYCDGKSVWSSNTGGNPGAYLAFQPDGNLVIYSISNAVLWQSFTNNQAGDQIQLSPQTGLFQVGIFTQSGFRLLFPENSAGPVAQPSAGPVAQPSADPSSKPSSNFNFSFNSLGDGYNATHGKSEMIFLAGLNSIEEGIKSGWTGINDYKEIQSFIDPVCQANLMADCGITGAVGAKLLLDYSKTYLRYVAAKWPGGCGLIPCSNVGASYFDSESVVTAEEVVQAGGELTAGIDSLGGMTLETALESPELAAEVSFELGLEGAIEIAPLLLIE
jgi:hypothetical protein